MTRLRPLRTAVLLLSVVGIATAASPEEQPTRVSLIQLIATPERFEGRLVEVRGFCRYVFEEHAIYLHREDAELVNAANGIWLDVESKEYESLNDNYVFVVGAFTAKEHGHLGSWPGELQRIIRLEWTPTRAEIRHGPPKKK